jgi:hypothetical protein
MLSNSFDAKDWKCGNYCSSVSNGGMIVGGAALLAVLLLPGWSKLLAIVPAYYAIQLGIAGGGGL